MPLVFTRRAFHNGTFTSGIAALSRYGRIDTAGGALRFNMLTQPQWFSDLDRQSGDGSILIAVHGYNTSQSRFLARLVDLEGRLRAAGFRGALLGYDWPSLSMPLRYRADRRIAKAIAPFLVQDGILPLLAQAPRPRLHMLAHSMGCYLVLKALAQFGDGAGSPKWLDQVLFTAADVNDAMMQRGAAGTLLLDNRARRFTHYYNPLDDVLAVPGRIINGGNARSGRLGMSSPRYPSQHDVSCQAQFRRDARGTAGSDFDNMLLSHGWWFDNDGFVTDAALTLGGRDAGTMPTRQRIQDGDQRLLT